MAASVPVVTMNFGGTAEIVEHGVSGYALPAASSAWENALRRLASDPELRAAMGRAAHERIQSRFAPAATACDCLALYESVLAERR
jgi:glycosyltransferase involved in cell wall biosynthesis